jgi:capsular polysaccharide biosynthesis protein
LNHSNILEIDLNTGEIFSFDSVNNIYVSNDSFLFEAYNIYVGNAVSNTLHNLYSGWNYLHFRLISNSESNTETVAKTEITFPQHFYMSRRNLLDPTKRTNTRILDNLEEVSDIIVNKNYKEIFTDELENLDDRIHLFQNAKSIVCELGAGMHNLLYCNEGTTIYVLFQRNNYSWLQEYFPLFENKKMKVMLLIGETTNPNHNGNWLNTPWKIVISELDKIPICS